MILAKFPPKLDAVWNINKNKMQPCKQTVFTDEGSG